jgi:hypothetical protein
VREMVYVNLYVILGSAILQKFITLGSTASSLMLIHTYINANYSVVWDMLIVLLLTSIHVQSKAAQHAHNQ